MSEEKRIDQEAFQKALEALQNLSKGHNSRGTASTQVDSMREGSVGAGSGAGSTQVHHTENNSDPGGWAGSTERSCPEDGATDAVQSDGTDYKGGAAKFAKSILDKLSKGQPLTNEEFEFVNKGGMAYAMKDGDDEKKSVSKAKDEDEEKSVSKAKDEDDDDESVGKSLGDFASESEDIRNGMEISPFLADFVGAVNKSLRAMEHRVVERVVGALASEAGKNEEFNKSLASALGALGEGSSGAG